MYMKTRKNRSGVYTPDQTTYNTVTPRRHTLPIQHTTYRTIPLRDITKRHRYLYIARQDHT